MMMQGFVSITRITQLAPGVSLVSFDTGETRRIEWKKYAKPGTLYEMLADPTWATKCRIIDGGDALSWPNGMDWSAGAVYKAGSNVTLAASIVPATKGEIKRVSSSRNKKKPATAAKSIANAPTGRGTIKKGLAVAAGKKKNAKHGSEAATRLSAVTPGIKKS